MDIEIVAPAGPLGTFSLFAHEKATGDQMSAFLASSGLEAKREGERIVVRRRGAPKAVVLPLDPGGLVGHVAYRSGGWSGPYASWRAPSRSTGRIVLGRPLRI